MSRFGMHGKVMAHPGQRDALVQVLLAAAALRVKELITRGRPLIAGFGESVRTVPVGGKGLTPSQLNLAAAPQAAGQPETRSQKRS
jgi:hypothetical protein